jgi:DNA-directed RNA polymerase subunit beta'
MSSALRHDLVDPAIDVEAGCRPASRRSRSARCSTCTSESGVCATRATAVRWPRGKLVDIGEAVGIVAAPVHRRARHAADDAHLPHRGVAGEDITQWSAPRAWSSSRRACPRARPRIAEVAGPRAHRDATPKLCEDHHRSRRRRAVVVCRTTSCPGVSACGWSSDNGPSVWSADGDHVEAGSSCTAVRTDPRRCCASRPGARCRSHLVEEVQDVYRAQGVSIHDKHIEVIIRQMLAHGHDHRVGRH